MSQIAKTPNNRAHSECWACGRVCPRRYQINRAGWVWRVIPDLGGTDQRETYCPECFAKWGWPSPQTEAATK